MRQLRPPHINTAGTARRLRTYTAVTLLGLALAGCQENGYRTEVKGNGQGGVEVKRVPKEPEAPTERANAPAPTSTPTTRPVSSEDELRTKVEAMQAQIDRQNQEIQRLQHPTTAPAIQP